LLLDDSLPKARSGVLSGNRIADDAKPSRRILAYRWAKKNFNYLMQRNKLTFTPISLDAVERQKSAFCGCRFRKGQNLI